MKKLYSILFSVITILSLHGQPSSMLTDIPTPGDDVELIKLKGDSVFGYGGFSNLYEVVKNSQGIDTLQQLMTTGNFFFVDLNSKQASGIPLNPDGRVWDFEVNDSLILLAGEFDHVNGLSRKGFAVYNYVSDTLYSTPILDKYAYSVELLDSVAFASGYFTKSSSNTTYNGLLKFSLNSLSSSNPFNINKSGSFVGVTCDSLNCLLFGDLASVNNIPTNNHIYFNGNNLSLFQNDNLNYNGGYTNQLSQSPTSLIQFTRGGWDHFPVIKTQYYSPNFNFTRSLLFTYGDCDDCWGINSVASNSKVVIAGGLFDIISDATSYPYNFTDERFGNIALYYHDSGYVNLNPQDGYIGNDARSVDINDKYAVVGRGVYYDQFGYEPDTVITRALEVYVLDSLNLRPSIIGPLEKTACLNDTGLNYKFMVSGSDQYNISVSSQDSLAIQINDYSLDSVANDVYALNIKGFDSTKTVRFNVELNYENGKTYNRFFEVKVKDIPETPTLSFTNDTLFSSTDSLQHVWYTQNGEFTGYDLPFIYHPDDNYTFRVRSIGQNGCLSNFSNSVFVSGRENVEEKKAVNIFPNPNDGTFSIENNADVDIINVYDATGKIVYSQKINSKRQKISTNLSPGIYFLVPKSADNSTNKSKLIITE